MLLRHSNHNHNHNSHISKVPSSSSPQPQSQPQQQQSPAPPMASSSSSSSSSAQPPPPPPPPPAVDEGDNNRQGVDQQQQQQNDADFIPPPPHPPPPEPDDDDEVPPPPPPLPGEGGDEGVNNGSGSGSSGSSSGSGAAAPPSAEQGASRGTGGFLAGRCVRGSYTSHQRTERSMSVEGLKSTSFASHRMFGSSGLASESLPPTSSSLSAQQPTGTESTGNPKENNTATGSGVVFISGTGGTRHANSKKKPKDNDFIQLQSLVVEGGQVKAGTPEALIIRLTTEKYGSDTQFMHHFLLTFSAHTTPIRLLELLVNRYNKEPPDSITSPEDREVFMKAVVFPIRLRVFIVLTNWVERLWNSGTNPELVEKLREFATASAPVMKVASDKLIKAINKSVSGEETKRKTVFDTPFPAPLVPLVMALGHPFPVDTLSMNTIHLREIARQITLIEQSMFRAIKPWELIGLAWTKKDKSLAPNVSKMVQHFNKISHWVVEEICEAEDLSSRIKKMEMFIELGNWLDDLHNYNAVMEIIAGLTNSAIFRLKKTWNAISAWHTKVFDYLRELTNNAKNYAEMRKKLHSVPLPCIPYLGIYQTDLTFIEEGNQTWLGENVNFNKCRLLATVILEIQQYQQSPYCLETVETVCDWISSRALAYSEDACYKRSLIIEPRGAEGTDSKINVGASTVALIAAGTPTNSPSSEGAEDSVIASSLVTIFTGEESSVNVLLPAEFEPTLFSVPCNCTVADATRIILEKWYSKQKPTKKPTPMTTLPTNPLPSTSAPTPTVPNANPSPPRQPSRGSGFSFVIPASKSVPAFVTNDHMSIKDLITSNPTYTKKGGEYFAILSSPTFVHIAYISNDSCIIYQPILDCNAPLSLMTPILASAFDSTTELIFFHYENGSILKWVHAKQSYNEIGISANGLLVACAVQRLSRVETEDGIRTRLQTFNNMEGVLCGYMSKLDCQRSKPTHLDLTTKRRLPAREKPRWLVAVDGLLLCYTTLQAPAPKRILSLQYYDVVYVKDGTQLAVMLKPIIKIPKSPLVISCANEDTTRNWFQLLTSQSRVNERTKQFGIDLKIVASHMTCSLVPLSLRESLEHLYNHALTSEKIFTTEGPLSPIEKLKSLYDSGQDVDLCGVDNNAIGELVRVFLAELPEPLLTYSLWPKFSKIGEQVLAGEKPDLSNLKWHMHQAPGPNLSVLSFLLAFLRYWAESCNLKMEKVCTIFGPFILRPAHELEAVDSLPLIVKLSKIMMENHNQLAKYDAELIGGFQRKEFKEPPPVIKFLSPEQVEEIANQVTTARGDTAKRGRASGSGLPSASVTQPGVSSAQLSKIAQQVVAVVTDSPRKADTSAPPSAPQQSPQNTPTPPVTTQKPLNQSGSQSSDDSVVPAPDSPTIRPSHPRPPPKKPPPPPPSHAHTPSPPPPHRTVIPEPRSKSPELPPPITDEEPIPPPPPEIPQQPTPEEATTTQIQNSRTESPLLKEHTSDLSSSPPDSSTCSVPSSSTPDLPPTAPNTQPSEPTTESTPSTTTSSTPPLSLPPTSSSISSNSPPDTTTVISNPASTGTTSVSAATIEANTDTNSSPTSSSTTASSSSTAPQSSASLSTPTPAPPTITIAATSSPTTTHRPRPNPPTQGSTGTRPKPRPMPQPPSSSQPQPQPQPQSQPTATATAPAHHTRSHVTNNTTTHPQPPPTTNTIITNATSSSTTEAQQSTSTSTTTNNNNQQQQQPRGHSPRPVPAPPSKSPPSSSQPPPHHKPTPPPKPHPTSNTNNNTL
ncbi:ras GEF [Pelomyxa schiedti]|nr:ras GEF [Pelomyxa schiedti]